MAINLKQLSAQLGLSPTTVSRALGGYSDVSPSTRERVEQAAKDLGYQPNLAARQVARGRADAVGIIYPLDTEYLGNPAFLETLGAMAHRLQKSGLDLLLAAASPQDEMQVYERMVRGRRVDAIVVAHTLVDDPRIDYLLRARMPVLAYGRTQGGGGFPWFDFDNAAGSRLAVEHLVDAGHRRIAYVHSPLRFNFAFERQAGFTAAMKAAGLKVSARMVLNGHVSRRAGYSAGQQLLGLATRPTAVIVDNASAGVGLIRALLDSGCRIGRDISVVVYEGLPTDTVFQGLDVASVLQPTPNRTGQTLAEMLLQLISGQPLSEPHVLRQPEYRDGNSVAPPPA